MNEEYLYFYHPESDCCYKIKSDEERGNTIDDDLSIEISKKEYEKRIGEVINEKI